MAFLRKIWEIVNNPWTEAVVHWSDSGESFVIADTGIFMAEIVPGYFKLKKFKSFCRQLNAYGFNKVRGAAWEFENTNFKRGQPQLLTNMKRNNTRALHNNEVMMMIEEEEEVDAGIDDTEINWDAFLAADAEIIDWNAFLADDPHFPHL